MEDYFTKHYPPHHHRKIRATYLYMENDLLKIDHKIVHEWANAVLMPIHTVATTPIHTVATTPNLTVLQGCDNVVHTYGHKKYQNSNIVHMTGVVRGSLSVRKMARCVDTPRTN